MRLTRLGIGICALLWLAPVLPANPADRSQIVEQGDRVQLNLKNVDIAVVVEYLARFNDEHYIVDPTVKANISVVANKPVSRQDAVVILEQTINFYGFTIVKDGLIRKVIPTRFAKQMGITVKENYQDIEKLSSGGMEMRFFKLEWASVRKMNTLLNTIIGRDGQIIPYAEDRILQIIDSTAGMQRIADMLQKMDVPDSLLELYVIYLENTLAEPTINHLKNVFTKNLVLRNSPNEVETDEDRINFYSDPRTNVILVVTHPKYIEQIRETVRILDQGQGNIQQLKIYPVQHASPDVLSKQILDAFPANSIKITPDERLKALIIMAQSPKMLDTVVSVAKRLDIRGDESQSDVQVYYLEHTVAKDISETLNKLFEKKNTQQNQTAAKLEPVSIVPDEATNSLVITGTKQQYLDVLNVIKKLDIFRSQVMVEAVIVEVSESAAKNFGTRFGGFEAGSGFNIAGLAQTVTPGLNNGITIAAVDSGVKTFSDVVNDPLQIRAFLNALKTSSFANVLSSPQILTKDNQEAKITVGEIISLPTGVNTNLSNLNNTTPINFSREDVGLDLAIKPRITQKKTITLEIKLDVKNRGTGTDNPLSGVNIPSITKRSVDTTISTVDGGTVAIGGLLQDSKNDSNSEVPLLAKLPGIGKLFKSRSREVKKTNLFIFLTPYILNDQNETDHISKRIHNEMLNAQNKLNTETLSFDREKGATRFRDAEIKIQKITSDGILEDVPLKPVDIREPHSLHVSSVEEVLKTRVEPEIKLEVKPEIKPEVKVEPRKLNLPQKKSTDNFEEMLDKLRTDMQKRASDLGVDGDKEFDQIIKNVRASLSMQGTSSEIRL